MELQKIQTQNGLVVPGANLLELLREHWGDEVVEKEIVALDENNEPCFKIVKARLASANKRNNAEVPAEIWDIFRALEIPEIEARKVAQTIQAGTFNALQAVKALDVKRRELQDKSFKPQKWSDSFERQSTTLAALRKYRGEEVAVVVIYTILHGFVIKFAKSKTSINKDLLEELARDVVDQYPAFKVSDLQYIFRSALFSGEKIFQLDYYTLAGMIKDAWEERQAYALEVSLDQHSQATSGVHQREDDRTEQEKATQGIFTSIEMLRAIAPK